MTEITMGLGSIFIMYRGNNHFVSHQNYMCMKKSETLTGEEDKNDYTGALTKLVKAMYNSVLKDIADCIRRNWKLENNWFVHCFA